METHGARVSDSVSSTQVELQAILEGLRQVVDRGKDVYVFVDSKSALESLNSHRPLHPEIVVQCRRLVTRMESQGVGVRFMWIPAHVGLRYNECVDGIAKEASQRDEIEVICALSLKQVRNKISRTMFRDADLQCRELGRTSQTMTQYLFIYDNVRRSSSRTDRTLVDTVRCRLRLGYRYYWECPWSKRTYSASEKRCRVCGAADSHTLRHYVMTCPNLVHFRNANVHTLEEQIVWLLRDGVLEQILNEFPNFAPRY